MDLGGVGGNWGYACLCGVHTPKSFQNVYIFLN